MYLSGATSKEILQVVNNEEIREGEALLLLIGEKNRPDMKHLLEGLRERGIDFFGGIFPGIIHGTHQYQEGVVLSILSILEKPYLIKGLDVGRIDIPDFSARIDEKSDRRYTAMILVDGLSSGISLCLSELFNYLGDTVNYFGGGAGPLTLEQEPCLFTAEGFFQDAAIITFLELESSLGVRHGWEKIMGPLVATKTNKNTILELNWENAFQVYKETVEADSGKNFGRDNFFDIAKGYPFGIQKEGAEDIVRDPIAVNDEGALFWVGEVPENAILSILKGRDTCLIKAAGQAAEECITGGDKTIKQSFIVDCISRAIFLGEDFTKEIEKVNQKICSRDGRNLPLGMMTLGEISSYGDGFLEFLNKTIVIASLYQR